MSRNTKLPTGIYAITDPLLLPGDSLIAGVEKALLGGVRVLQYRNKIASRSQQLLEAKALKALCQQFDACFIVNDDIELAKESCADGVHLGKSDGSIAKARKVLGSNKVIGVTCHNDLTYARACIDEGADYCAFGRFFPSQTKPNASLCEQTYLPDIAKLKVPVVAIGGITVDNMASLMDTPFNNLAVIHSLFGQDDIEQAAKLLCTQFNKHALVSASFDIC